MAASSFAAHGDVLGTTRWILTVVGAIVPLGVMVSDFAIGVPAAAIAAVATASFPYSMHRTVYWT